MNLVRGSVSLFGILMVLVSGLVYSILVVRSYCVEIHESVHKFSARLCGVEYQDVGTVDGFRTVELESPTSSQSLVIALSPILLYAPVCIVLYSAEGWVFWLLSCLLLPLGLAALPSDGDLLAIVCNFRGSIVVGALTSLVFVLPLLVLLPGRYFSPYSVLVEALVYVYLVFFFV